MSSPISKGLKRKIAEKCEFNRTKNYYRRYGFDNQQDFWSYAKEVYDIDKEIEKEDKERRKAVAKATSSIFRSVIRKAKREAPKYSVRERSKYKTFTTTNDNHTIKIYHGPDVKRFILSKRAIRDKDKLWRVLPNYYKGTT
jgi:hypothetical protein